MQAFPPSAYILFRLRAVPPRSPPKRCGNGSSPSCTTEHFLCAATRFCTGRLRHCFVTVAAAVASECQTLRNEKVQ